MSDSVKDALGGVKEEGSAARLRELIARLEAATGPDRELDWLIADAVGLVPKHSIRAIGWDYDWYRNSDKEWALWKANDSEGRNNSLWEPARYTSSIDAALTLVPEGCSVHLHIMPREIGHKAVVGIGNEGESKTPALALCIAALKARLDLTLQRHKALYS